MECAFIHPQTREPLEKRGDAYLSASGDTFEPWENVPCFLSKDLRQDAEQERAGFVNDLKTFLRKFPRLYVFLIYLISPVCFIGLSPKKFAKQYGADDLVLNVGSGIHRYSAHMINLDLYPYKGVDVVADAMALPFPDNSIDGAICDYLLEHVPYAEKVVAEIHRVLKPGGKLYIGVPFVYPFHASPNDFHRWTVPGLKTLCHQYTPEIVAPRSGPTTALVAQLVTWCAIAFSFGNTTLYNALSTLLLLPFFPLKFLDLIIGRFPTAIHGPGSVYGVFHK